MQAWPSPTAGAPFFDLGSVFTMNGLSPQATFKPSQNHRYPNSGGRGRGQRRHMSSSPHVPSAGGYSDAGSPSTFNSSSQQAGGGGSGSSPGATVAATGATSPVCNKPGGAAVNVQPAVSAAAAPQPPPPPSQSVVKSRDKEAAVNSSTSQPMNQQSVAGSAAPVAPVDDRRQDLTNDKGADSLK